jgi:hypothetical protein
MDNHQLENKIASGNTSNKIPSFTEGLPIKLISKFDISELYKKTGFANLKCLNEVKPLISAIHDYLILPLCNVGLKHYRFSPY